MDSNNFDNPSLKDGFAGNRKYLKGFLAKMQLIFALHPENYESDSLKVAYVISRLYGDALNWAATLINNNDPSLNNYSLFISRLRSVYGDYDSTFIANQKLRTIKQKQLGKISGYINEFNRYSDESNWNEEAKMDAFTAGLQNQVANRILEMYPGPQTLIGLQTVAARIDARISNQRNFFSNNKPTFSNYSKSHRNKGKQRTHRGPISNEEKERRRKENLCMYCGSASHTLDNCPLKKKNNPNDPSTSTSYVSNPTNNQNTSRPRISDDPNISQLIIKFNLQVSNVSINTKILLDSGSQFNLMDVYFAKACNIPVIDDQNLPTVTGIGGCQPLLGITPSILLTYKNHICYTTFYLVDLPSYNCLLGSDWLVLHNPTINFSNKDINFVSNYCLSNCITTPSILSLKIRKSSNNCNIISEKTPKSKSKSKKSNSSVSLPVTLINSISSTSSTNDSSTIINIETKLPKQLLKFKEVFNESIANTLPPHRPYDCEINLKPNSKLFYGAIYQLTQKESDALEEYIKENLKKGFIRKSKSPAGAPVLFVPKKNDDLRMCVDYRHLNDITIRDSYPIPLIAEMLENIPKGKIFSKLDLKSAYYLVRIKSGDEYKTAFTCKFGHFEYLVMPFGLKNAPAVFQHFINDVLEGILGKYVYAYIDDIIIFSPNLEIHIKHVSEVLSRLQNAGLVANLEKCEFFVPYIDFLGHRFSANGVFMDPKKVSAILEWPIPKCVKDVQSFIGLSNYYRKFIENFAKISHPLNKLTRKNVKFVWSKDAQDAFDTLKYKFTTAPILIPPNYDLPYIVETDSSNFAIGAILSQRLQSDNSVHPIAFYSRSLTSTERNYSIYDKELLAIVDSLENWRHLLKGTSTPFTIFSDHRNLLFNKKPEKMTQRHVRWSLFLAEFNFVIKYRTGSSNGKADSFSRRIDYIPPDSSSSKDVPLSVLRPENFCALASVTSSLNDKILSSYKKDKFYNEFCTFLSNKSLPAPHPQHEHFTLSNKFLLFDNKIYVPSECRLSVLQICHDSPSAGHFGIRKTLNLIKRNFWWSSMSSDVKDYVRSCDVCCRSKESRHKPYGFLQPLPISSRPWSSISMDFITDLPNSNGFTCILVVVDRLTKMCNLIPFKSIPSSEETAIAFRNSIFRSHGLPDEIITDRGTQFTSKFWSALCKSFHVNLKFSSPFHHQSNGQTERVNSVIEQYLRCFSNYKGTDWSKFLDLAEFSYNNAVQDSTKYSPFYLNYGFHPNYSPAIINKTNVPKAEEYLKNLNEVMKDLKKNLEQSLTTQKKYADNHRSKPPEFKENDKVWLDSSLVLHGGNKKMKPRKLGPFRIKEKISDLAYKLELPENIKIHPVVHVSSLEPFYEDEKFRRKQEPPPPVIINNEEEYEVEKILDERKYYGKKQYLIKWKGYPLSEASWEPESNLNCPDLIKEFKKSK